MRGLVASIAFVMLFVCELSLCSDTESICPNKCHCRRSHAGIVTDCSNANLPSVPTQYIHPDTTHLDLRRNNIRFIRKNAFFGLSKLSTLLLDDNRVSDIEAHAFSGLSNVVRLSIRRNRLKLVRRDALAGVSGDESTCAARQKCVIDLRDNDVVTVERNAFAWVRRLSVLLGGGDDHLTIDAYAFYGVRDVPRVEIRDVPTLTLKPRIFTNAENVGAVLISGAHLPVLRNFTFEGLKNVHTLEFADCILGDVHPFAFSGIHYAASPEVTWNATAMTLARSDEASRSYVIVSQGATPEPDFLGGGLVKVTGCRVDVIPTDAFRDTNLASVVIVDSVVSLVDKLAFRGMSKLHVLVIARSRLVTLSRRCFGEISRVRQLLFYYNIVDEIPAYAFKNSEGIGRLSFFLLRNASLVLRSSAFTHLIDTTAFEMIGASDTRLTIEADAFQNMFGVMHFRIAYVTLPVVARNTFRGLGKVKQFELHDCRVSLIEEDAFGVSYGLGAIDTFDMSVGNALPCDCVTAKRMREFENTFSRYIVYCTELGGHRRIITADDAYACKVSSAGITLLSSAVTTFTYCLLATHCYILTSS